MDTTHEPDSREPDDSAKTPKKAALASWVGSVLEYYDFFIYGTAAALVFGKVFFPESDPATGTLLSLATYGVGYVARPDRRVLHGPHRRQVRPQARAAAHRVAHGRCRPSSSAACPPTTPSASGRRCCWWRCDCCRASRRPASSPAPTRSASSTPPSIGARFFTSFTLSGTQAGLIIATAVFLPIGALPEDQLLSWGWRVPFWLSAVVVVVGLLIRRRLEETPAFREEAANAAVAKVPTADLFRDHWAGVLRVALAAIASTVSTIFAVYALSFAVDTKGLDQTTMLWVAIVTNVVALAAIPAVGRCCPTVSGASRCSSSGPSAAAR